MRIAALTLLAAMAYAAPALAQGPVTPAVEPAPLSRGAGLPALQPAAPQVDGLISPMMGDELDEVRGGFLVAGQLAFEFGAVVRTFKDGMLALQTQVNWSDAGPVITRMTDNALNGLAGAGSQVLQRVDNGQLTNILLNTESNHDFRQETDITLTLPGFAATQQAIGGNLTAQRLADDVSLGAVGALR